MEQEPQLTDRLTELQAAISNSPEAIQAEFSRTANDWLSCFGSRVFLIETYLSSKKLEILLPVEQYQGILAKLERLKDRLSELKKQYPDKNTIPSDEIKQELLAALEILKEI